MALDLETLRKDVEDYFTEVQIPVFYGTRQMMDTMNEVSWDTERHPDFRDFLKAGQEAGAKLVVFSYRAFSLDQVDEALDMVEDSNLTRDEKRGFEARLRQLQGYEGFTCSLDLSFTLEGDIYTFELRTDWYEALTQIMAELDMIAEGEEENGQDGSLGGYFSKN
jgi:hypothetical protein